jgi:methylated-DNA-[protein]-cysteine S-methyltransferase
MTASGYALFDTAIGRGGIVWGADGIVGVQLPEARVLATRARIRRRFPDAREGAPPADVQRALDGIVTLLDGGDADLREVALDMAGVSAFEREVYEIARTIPAGETTSYGAIAAELGDPGAARAVGRALGQNPFPVIVPCHRVVAADGSLGGFSAAGGADTKRRMLAIEGAPAAGAPTLFDAPARFDGPSTLQSV